MSATSPGRAKQEIGLAVTDFALPLISGEGERSLDDYLRGKKGALIVFWSGICAHCVRYDDYLNLFSERHSELGLVTIASRLGETEDQIRTAVAKRNLSFPILHDAPSAVARQWFTQQTPRVFLIDSDRKLLYRGAIDNFKFPEDSEYLAYLEPAIASFLAGAPVARADTPSFGCPIQSVYYILPKPM